MNKLLHGICSCCIWCSVLFAIFSHVDLYAQNQISGQVVDSSGEPILGATVLYNGGQSGTATGLDGSFTIDAGPGTEVTVSFIGFQTAYIKMTPNIVITLKEDENEIDEVVVVGYGTIKAKELTGSVSVVNMGDLEDAAVTTIDQALEGRVTGIQVISSDGQPGSEASIVIRGVGSMDDSSPLYVIDGFPQEESDFASLNPEDIDAMTVLKDASSTAIYGSRGANGVILITTKRGKTGRPTVTYSGQFGAIRPTKRQELMDPYQFVRLQEDYVDQINLRVNAGYTYRGEDHSEWLGYTYHSEDRYAADYKDAEFVDWIDMMENENPMQQTHTVSIAGSKDGSRYYVSLNLVDQEGLLVNSGFQRYQGRMSVDQVVTDRLKMGLNASFASTLTFGDSATGGGTSSTALMNRVYQSRPTSWDQESLDQMKYELLDYPIYNEDYGDVVGSWPQTASYSSTSSIIGERFNPIINSQNTDKEKLLGNLSANAYVELNFLNEDLIIKGSGGYTNKNTTTTAFYTEETVSGHPDVTENGANGSISESLSTSLLGELTATYKKMYKDIHSINAIVGFTAQQDQSTSSGVTATNVPNGDLGVASLDSGTVTNASSGGSVSTLMSFFVRLNYALDSKYIFTFTARRDGTSKLAEGGKWGTFPSGAVAWRLMEEEFMEPISHIMNDAKIRVSYGYSGNNRVSDFESKSLITTTTNYRYSFGNAFQSYGAYSSQLINDELTWESVLTFNLGVELAFFKNRLKFEYDYYQKDTYDLLSSSSIASNGGFSTVKRNAGQISNEGHELSINTVNINKKGFNWSSTLNFSYNKNRLVSLASGEEAKLSSVTYLSESYIARVGNPVAQFYGYISEGHYQYDDFLVLESNDTYVSAVTGLDTPTQKFLLKDNIPFITSKIRTMPGVAKFKDINNDGEIDEDDRTVIGSPYPDHVGSLQNRFTYKGFNLNVYFTYSYGGEILNGTVMQFLYYSDDRSFGLNRYAYMSDYWSTTNTEARYPALHANSDSTRKMGTNYLEDGSYLRLNSVSLSYSVPKKIVSKLGLQQVRLSYTANNLWTLTNYQGQDPAVSVSYSATTPSYDNAAYPRTSTNTFGMTITL